MVNLLGLRSVLLELRCRIFLLGFRIELFERRLGRSFVGLPWLTILLGVGLAQFFVGVALSDFSVGLLHFCCLRGGRGNILLSSRGHHDFLFDVGLAQFFVEVMLSEVHVGLSQLVV